MVFLDFLGHVGYNLREHFARSYGVTIDYRRHDRRGVRARNGGTQGRRNRIRVAGGFIFGDELFLAGVRRGLLFWLLRRLYRGSLREVVRYRCGLGLRF